MFRPNLDSMCLTPHQRRRKHFRDATKMNRIFGHPMVQPIRCILLMDTSTGAVASVAASVGIKVKSP